MMLLVVGRVQENEPLEVASAIEDLDAAIVAIGHVDVVLAIDADVVQRVELAWVLVRMLAARSALSLLK
jgi:hypothetical protein